jgi:hypothetical protein
LALLLASIVPSSVLAQELRPSSSSSLHVTQSASSSTTRPAASSPTPTLTPTGSILSLSPSSSLSLLPAPSAYPSSILFPNSTLLLPNGTQVLYNSTSDSTSPLPPLNSTLPLPYAIKLDGAYGVTGAVLILSGLPVAAMGGKNRWSSLFLIPFYAGILVCTALILHFGVAIPENPPSATLRGMFVLIAFVVGAVTGGIAIFFWSLSKYFISLAGGFAFAWFILGLREDGLIANEVWRWVLLVGTAAGSFAIGLFSWLHNPAMVISTAWFVPPSALVLFWPFPCLSSPLIGSA